MLDDIGSVLLGVELRTHIRIIYVLYTYRKLQNRCAASDYTAPKLPFATVASGSTPDIEANLTHSLRVVAARDYGFICYEFRESYHRVPQFSLHSPMAHCN